jgi:hypothetical protein
MDNNEEIYKFVGQLVLDSHFQVISLNSTIKKLYEENSQLKEQLRIIQELQGNEQQ